MKLEINSRDVHVHVVGRQLIGELFEGVTDSRNDILIARENTRWERVDDLLHEIFHVILRPLKLNNKTEEKYVSALATGYMKILRDNPEYNPRKADFE